MLPITNRVFLYLHKNNRYKPQQHKQQIERHQKKEGNVNAHTIGEYRPYSSKQIAYSYQEDIIAEEGGLGQGQFFK